MKEQPRQGGAKETEGAAAAAEEKACGGPGQLQRYKLCRRKGRLLLFPIKQQIK